jgi:Flagellar basal body-associated protein
MKAVILLVLGIGLLGGAGYGGWMLYNMYMVPHDGEQPKKEEPPPKVPTSFVRLPPLVVPAIGSHKVDQFVTVVVTLEVVADKVPLVQAYQPKVFDKLLTTLYGAVDDKSVLAGNLVNIPVVKEKLTAAAAKVVGDGVVQNVLIQVVTQRNL